MHVITVVLSLFMITTTTTATQTTPRTGKLPAKPNFLIVIIDDMRWTNINRLDTATKELFVEGGQYTYTPNLDKFAEISTKFNRGFANVPWCGPSRASFLTGREPTQTKCYSLFDGGFRRTAGPVASTWQTLPQYLMNNGYRTYTAGKVFHPGQDDDDSPVDWTKVLIPNVNESVGYVLGNCGAVSKRPDTTWKQFYHGSHPLNNRLLAPFCCRCSANINLFDDFLIADAVTKQIRELGAEKPTLSSPFFIAAGFLRPHLPLHIHDSFWDLYGADTAQIPDPPYITPPIPKSRMPPLFAIPPGDDGTVSKIPLVYTGIAPNGFRRAFRLAYSAAISQTDAAIGRVFDTLNEFPNLSANTVIIMFGDNGFSLGESSLWFKQLLTDHATRVPFSMYIPFKPRFELMNNQTFVELVDVFPTVMELAGFPKAVTPDMPGKSLVSVYENGPSALTTATYATSMIPRCLNDRNCKFSLIVSQFGFSIRTDEWRYNVWLPSDTDTQQAIWSDPTKIIGEELYQHVDDGVEEHVNMAMSRKYVSVKADLFAQLQARFGKWGL